MKESEKQFDEKWYLPEKFRVTPELTPQMLKILEQSDERQKELAEIFGSPNATPQMRERARAVMIRDRFESYDRETQENLPDAQKSEWANAYAILGRYDYAVNVAPTGNERVEYHDIWLAVWRDESETCAHPDNHHYAEKDVYSVKLNADAVLMKCNICRFRNVKPIPQFIEEGRQKRAEYRNRFTGEHPHNLRNKE